MELELEGGTWWEMEKHLGIYCLSELRVPTYGLAGSRCTVGRELTYWRHNFYCYLRRPDKLAKLEATDPFLTITWKVGEGGETNVGEAI